jgi:hypothetical protein
MEEYATVFSRDVIRITEPYFLVQPPDGNVIAAAGVMN